MSNPSERRRAMAQALGSGPDSISAADLRVIADGPIMDAIRLYLPAGKISLAEAEARERAGMERLA